MTNTYGGSKYTDNIVDKLIKEFNLMAEKDDKVLTNSKININKNIFILLKTYGYSQNDTNIFINVISETTNIIKKYMTINGNYINQIVIKMYNIDKKKETKIGNASLIPANINSGYTIKYSSDNKRDVVVFRREENKKVLIHELIHVFEFEYYMFPEHEVKLLNEYLTNIYHVKNPHSFEGICDAIAIMIGIELRLFEKDKVYNHIWKKFGEIYLVSGNISWPPKYFDQDTHVFEYYFIKPIILYHYIYECNNIIVPLDFATIRRLLNDSHIIEKINISIENARELHNDSNNILSYSMTGGAVHKTHSCCQYRP